MRNWRIELCMVLFLIAGSINTPVAAEKLALDQWSYILVDSSRAKWGDWSLPVWLRSFGLAWADITDDGMLDLAAGRYFYRNPGGDMTAEWPRSDFGVNVDAMLFVDVDNDRFGDIIAQALPDIYWLEALDENGLQWNATRVAQLPPTGHVNGQGYALAQIHAGGKPEIVTAAHLSVYCIEIPENPVPEDWPKTRIAHNVMDEGIGTGDLDRDGDIDIVAGRELEENVAYSLLWFENPGDTTSDWPSHLISRDVLIPDRNVVADFNGDGRLDVAVSEERYPGLEPDASVYWFEAPADPARGEWTKHLLVTQYSSNNLDAADLDEDGDVDIVTCEHKGPAEKLEIFENDGRGQFTMHVIDTGKEMHLGARLADLDQDGDFEIVGVPWDDYPLLHLWRNDARSHPKPVKWQHKTTHLDLRTIERPDVGFQASAIVFDIDKDNVDDIIVAGWGHPSMVWLRPDGESWKRYIVDDKRSHVEAGGTYWDIDRDGDLDIVQGGSWNTNEVWWWENPYPDYDRDRPWVRHLIKNYGEKQHHDQIVGDFDGDGAGELVFWNQHAQQLLLADIPENPRKMENWILNPIWSWPKAFKYEGLAKIDVDLDGVIDLIGGGQWFKHLEGTAYKAELIDDYGQSRSAAGDLIEGGRPEIVLGSGDGIAPLFLYQWSDGAWNRTTLIDTVVHGHTLDVADFNGDGHLDIYTAEMHTPGAGPECRQWLLYGDGQGHFFKQILSIGIGTHEGKLGDLDGDGDVDILQKDFQHDRRIDIWLNQLK